MKSSQEYFEGMADAYPLHVHPRHYEYKAGLIKEFACGVVLDAGCADGHYLHVLRRHAKMVYGVDHTPEMVRLALYRTKQYKNVKILASDLSSIDLPSGSVDVIFCQSTFYYIKDQELVLEEFFRLLKPGGRLVLDVRREDSTENDVPQYATDLEWLLSSPVLKCIGERFPPQVGIMPWLRKLWGNSVPPTLTLIMQKRKV